MATQNDPQYNWVYKELVKGPDDVSGALAYVLYKNEKIAYIEKFAVDEMRQPTDADLQPFHRMTILPGRLDSYREQANALLEEFLDNALATQLNIFKAELRTDAVVNAVKPNFWSGVKQNIVAGLVTTLMSFGFILGAWMYSEGPNKIISGAASKFMNGDGPAQPVMPAQSQKPKE